MQIKLSQLQQKDVWDGWLGAETRALYFGELCRWYTQLQRLIVWSTALASSGAALSIISGLPNSWRLGLALVTAGLSLASVVTNNNKSATDCSDIHFRWTILANDYRALWDDMYSTDAPMRLASLLQRDAELSKTCNVLPNRTRQMRKWERYVVHQHGFPATT
jgi:hypothetical protein